MTISLSKLARGMLVTLALVFAVQAFAIDTEKAFEDPALQARYESINRELRCLVCQNQTIADSNATLAHDLRREVREMIAAGKTDGEIREFMIERYGDFVLYRPRLNATNFLLWAAPALLLLIGGGVAMRFIRRRTAEVDEDDAGSGAGHA